MMKPLSVERGFASEWILNRRWAAMRLRTAVSRPRPRPGELGFFLSRRKEQDAALSREEELPSGRRRAP